MGNKKIKVLPIYPSSPPSFWGFKQALKILGKKATMPPTGLLTVMSMFPKNEFEIMPIQDLNVQSLDEEAIEQADLVATSSMIIHESSHNKIIDISHKHNKKVVAGGPFPTVSPDRNQTADYIVAGEAEITLKPFIEDYLNGSPQKIYTEESVKERSEIILTKTGKPDLSQTPIPRWDLIPDLGVYYYIGIQYSRGCPNDCEFCNIISLFGREPRTKTPKQMIKEFEAIYDLYCHGTISLLDDNFIGNKKNIKQFLPELIKWQKQKNYPYEIGTEACMDLAWPQNKQILEDMVSAGFTDVFLGIESLDSEILQQMNKKQNLKMSPYEVVRKIQNAGLEVSGGLIIGNDNEKPEVFDDLYNFVQESGIVFPMVGLLGVIPGTKLAKRLEKEGRLKGKAYGSNTHSFTLNFEPKLAEGFTEKQLIHRYKGLLRDLFEPKNYYERCRVLQKELGPNHSKKYSTLEGLAILKRFAKHQLKGGANLETAKYLVQTLFKNPAKFPQAVTHAIKYQHLKEITRETLKADTYPSKLESMYNEFTHKSHKVMDKYKDNLQKASELISKKGEKLVAKAERFYNKIHPDFQKEHYYTALKTLKDKITNQECPVYNP